MANYDNNLVVLVARALWRATSEDLPEDAEARKDEFKANLKEHKLKARVFLQQLEKKGAKISMKDLVE